MESRLKVQFLIAFLIDLKIAADANRLHLRGNDRPEENECVGCL